jgi:hypothetical protein
MPPGVCPAVHPLLLLTLPAHLPLPPSPPSSLNPALQCTHFWFTDTFCGLQDRFAGGVVWWAEQLLWNYAPLHPERGRGKLAFRTSVNNVKWPQWDSPVNTELLG